MSDIPLTKILCFICRLTYEQGRILNAIDEILKRFDAELRLLRHEKFKLDITMKNADLRQVTLFEELVLLKEYEKREDVLAEKVSNKQQEKLDMQAKVRNIYIYIYIVCDCLLYMCFYLSFYFVAKVGSKLSGIFTGKFTLYAFTTLGYFSR